MSEKPFHLPLPFDEAIKRLAPAPKVAAIPKKPEAAKPPQAARAKRTRSG